MHGKPIAALKVLIAVLIALLIVCQALIIPVVAQQTALEYPELAHLRVPGIIITVAFLVCVQVALVCVWRLLTLVRAASIFSETSFAYVNVILGSVVAATILILGSFITLAAVNAVPPTAAIMCIFGIVVGAGLALLIVVLRGLLRKASQLEHDLSEVV